MPDLRQGIGLDRVWLRFSIAMLGPVLETPGDKAELAAVSILA